MTTIAIAGAKGGCGKTTTTLGLAEAVGRTGTTSLAVDADRQLPNLHLTGGTERTPTLAALEKLETDDRPALEDIAQQSPRVDAVGIVSAPTADTPVDVETALERLATGSVPVFVDCPSCAGPDLVEALSPADGVLVVTTETNRSLQAAETTVDIARRLDRRVLGVVCNRCESVPDAVTERFPVDVPILSAIPESDTPLTDELATVAFDDLAARLEPHLSPRPVFDADRLRTGLDELDRSLGGGLPPGSVLTLTAPSASQLEHLLGRMTVPRGTLYLATDRPVSAVERSLEATPLETGTPTIRSVHEPPGDAEDPTNGGRVDATDDGRTPKAEAATRAIDRALELVEKLPDGATLLVDSVDALERAERPHYRTFLHAVHDRMVETDGLAVLCVLEPSKRSNLNVRESRSLATQVADVALELEPTTGSSSGRLLSIRKCRFASIVPSTVDLTADLDAEADDSDDVQPRFK